MKLNYHTSETMFGTKILFASSESTYTFETTLDKDPFEQLALLNDGFWFWAPQLPEQLVKPVLETLGDSNSLFNFELFWDNETLSSNVRFLDQADATWFAMRHGQHYQKWNAEKEQEAQQNRDQPPPEDILDEAGNVIGKRIQVEVSTISDL